MMNHADIDPTDDSFPNASDVHSLDLLAHPAISVL